MNPFTAVPLRVIGRGLAERRGVIDSVLRLHGGEPVDAADDDATAPAVVGLETLATLPEGTVAALRSAPVLVLAEREGSLDEAALVALGLIADAPVRSTPAQSGRRYRFANAAELGPFRGVALDEAGDRASAGLESVGGQLETLVAAAAGPVVARVGVRGVLVSTVPLPDADAPIPLKHSFDPGSFMGLLALLLFARQAVGVRGWQRPPARASFLVDDPNLRFGRYGHLDLAAFAATARERGFHLGIAMIPLDYRKTRASTAALFRDNAEHLSVVIHGVDHRKREFEADVSSASAVASLAGGLARMAAHRDGTGIDHAGVMTFPHGVCNRTWLCAMRDVGLDAALVSRARPFATEAEIDDPLYEMHPAELGVRGFPVLNRFKAEEPVVKLLFQAFLGKPLVVYTHHQFFSDGLGRLTDIADYLERHVGPTWESVAAIGRGNYQQRQGDGTVDVRVFSNFVVLAPDTADRLGGIVKQADDIPADETLLIDGVETPLERSPGVAAVTGQSLARGGAMALRFGPLRPERASKPSALSVRSRARRYATELRDQVGARLGRA